MRISTFIAFAFSALIMLMLALSAGAVEGDSLWSRIYGGNDYEYAYSVVQAPDGGFVLAGYTDSFGAGYDDVYVVKTNASGDTLWTRTFGGDGYDDAQSIRPTSDGGYIIAGTSWSYSPSFDAELYLLRINAAGHLVWSRTYGAAYNCYGYYAEQTEEGGYILVGERGMAVSGNTDLYLIKTNSSGDTTWTRTIGTTTFDCGYCVQEISDGYIISGTSRPSGPSNNDVFLVKVNLSGNTVWTKTYGGTGTEEGTCVRQTTDGGFIISSFNSFETGRFDAWLLKTDASGDTLWTHAYGDTSGSEKAYWVEPTTDNGYIFVGMTTSWGDIFRNLYLVKTDASGTMQWYRTFGQIGDNEDGFCVQQTSDGDYIVAGETSGFSNSHQAWLLKIEGSGTGVVPQSPLQPFRTTLYPPRPNPFNASTTISYELRTASFVSLQVYDISGSLVQTLVDGWRETGAYQAAFDGAGLPSGIYIYRLQAGEFTASGKMVMVK
ncbi:MAG: T9SS type A sorting domain-containing protein [bacterium]|nr:T9SS type A sorting domain-containing protein [bacterium]